MTSAPRPHPTMFSRQQPPGTRARPSNLPGGRDRLPWRSQVFVLGRLRGGWEPNHNFKDISDEEVLAEAERKKDIVQFDFVEDSDRLSLKSYLASRWVLRRCKEVAFVAKEDDDTFLDFISYQAPSQGWTLQSLADTDGDMLRALSAIFLMSQYVFNPVPVDWDAAVLHCSQSDSQLLVPTSDAEVDVVQRLMLTFNVTAIHVGIHDKFLEGRYVTLHGEQIGEAVGRHWARGAPHGGMSRNCVAMTTSGLVDVECRQPLNSLCQRRQWRDYLRLAPHGRYRLLASPASWVDAWATCRADHANLVVLNSDDEVRTLIRAFPGEEAIWVGAHALYHENAGFTTVHGDSLESAGFVRWDDTVPRAAELRTRPYAALHGLRGLRAHGSSTRLKAICERSL